MCSQFVFIMNSFIDKCCIILKPHCCNSKAHRVINLEMGKILKEKGFNDVLPGQKLCRQCVPEYEKLTNPHENQNMTEIILTTTSQIHKFTN